jgi:hypothetical protein
MKKIKLFSISLALLWMSSPLLHADSISNNFSAHLNQKDLDEFSKDIGALINNGSFHEGKALGFPLGFDVGVHGSSMKIDSSDPILRDDGSKATSLGGQAEVGLPFKINLIVRGGTASDVDYLGGGLRLGLFHSKVPLMPSVSMSALYNNIKHDYFDGNTITGNVVVALDTPFVRPYLGVGYDHTEIKATSKAYVGAAASTPTGLKTKTDAPRVEIGVNISLLPFTYINLGYGQSNGQESGHAGVGVKF